MAGQHDLARNGKLFQGTNCRIGGIRDVSLSKSFRDRKVQFSRRGTDRGWSDRQESLFCDRPIIISIDSKRSRPGNGWG
eukprot:6186707-Pleurochrysis_carterae.AAC.2